MRFCQHPALLLLAALATDAALALDLLPVKVGSATFQVELAKTASERAKGLMFRPELPAGQGMLFVQEPGPAAFWMKNTLIALDLLYFDAKGQLVQIIAEASPCTTPTCPIYSSKATTIRYILEINAGEAARRGIQVGDPLETGLDIRP